MYRAAPITQSSCGDDAGPSAANIKTAIARVNQPIGSERCEICKVHDEDPVRGAAHELRCDACDVPRRNQAQEHPRRADSRPRFPRLHRVNRPRQAKTYQHHRFKNSRQRRTPPFRTSPDRSGIRKLRNMQVGIHSEQVGLNMTARELACLSDNTAVAIRITPEHCPHVSTQPGRS